MAINDAKTIALSRWRGVDLVDGDNELAAKILDENGAVVWQGKRTVHYGGGPVRAELDKQASKLIADGRTRPVIALRMFDKYGKPARAGTIANFSVDSPYRSWWEVEQLDDNQILSTGSREPQVEVRENGLALVELEPTTTTGNAMLRLRFNERQSDEIKVWLTPAARDWILVGIAEGTAAYNTISGNMETASAADREEGLQNDGRVAFFAKGRIKGDFLLTAAYDSAREKEDARDRLQGTIEPDRYYLLYGDGTEQRFEAASQSKLYLKIERRQFVALFGDFDTGFTVTELTKYNRSLSGLRADFGGERVQMSGFRGAHRHRPGAGRVAGRRHLGPVSPVARAHRHRLGQDAHRGPRQIRNHARGRDARALALHRLRPRLRAWHGVLQGAGAEPRP